MSSISLWMLAYLWAVVVTPCQSWGQPASEKRRNYYDTLGVQQTATDRQVKKAFRKLALTYHPDRNKTKDAERIFREIAEAYEVLSNKVKRKRYDELGHEAYLETEGDSDVHHAEDDTTPFYFSFDQLFEGSDYGDDPFLAESEHSWSFPIEYEDNFYEDHGFLNFFDHLGDSHYEYQDEVEQRFCYMKQQTDGSIVEECEEEW